MSVQVCGVKSGARAPSQQASLGLVGGIRTVAVVHQPVGEERGRMEDDSHADTCLLGKGWKVIYDRGHTCEVEGFSDDIGSLSLPVVYAITVATTSEGEEVIVRVNQALWKPDEDK